MTDQTENADFNVGTSANAHTPNKDYAGPAFLVWGHHGPGRDEMLERATHGAGDAAISMIVLDGETIFTFENIKQAIQTSRAFIYVEIGRGADHVIRKQCVILHRAGISGIFVVIGSAGGSFSKVRYEEITRKLNEFTAATGVNELTIIPLNSFKDASVEDEKNHPVLTPEMFSSGIVEDTPPKSADFRLSVTSRTNENGAVVNGTILSGRAGVGDQIVALPSSQTAEIQEIVHFDDGRPAQIHLTKQLKTEPGQIIAQAEGRPEIADQIRAKLFWLSETPMLVGRTYAIELAGQTATATITDIRFKESYDSQEQIAARRLHKGELGEVNLSFDKDLAFDAFEKLPETGLFCLRDMTGHDTITPDEVGTGLVLYGLRRATNIHRQAIDIDASARAMAKGQKPCCIWFTGLSGSGKSTIANALETRLHAMGHHTYILDGDNVRHGLNRDLGFTDADRVENIRRIGEVAKLMVDGGLIVMTAFISPFRSERRMARELLGDGQFIEVFVDTSLDVCEARDPKGLYKKARAGEIANFTGIDSAYEAPERAELSINAGTRELDQVVEEIIESLLERKMLTAD